MTTAKTLFQIRSHAHVPEGHTSGWSSLNHGHLPSGSPNSRSSHTHSTDLLPCPQGGTYSLHLSSPLHSALVEVTIYSITSPPSPGVSGFLLLKRSQQCCADISPWFCQGFCGIDALSWGPVVRGENACGIQPGITTFPSWGWTTLHSHQQCMPQFPHIVTSIMSH